MEAKKCGKNKEPLEVIKGFFILKYTFSEQRQEKSYRSATGKSDREYTDHLSFPFNSNEF